MFVTKKGQRQLHIEWFILGSFRPGQMTWSPWKRASRFPCHLKTAFAYMILFLKEEFVFFKYLFEVYIAAVWYKDEHFLFTVHTG